jgi:hypothetical protein
MSFGILQANWFWMFLRKLVARRCLRLHVSNQRIIFFIWINEIKVIIGAGIILAEGKLPSNHTLIFDDTLRLLAALMVRTWAVWHNNRYIGAGLSIVWIATCINGSYFISNFVKSFVSEWFIRSTYDADVFSKPQTLWRLPRLLPYDYEYFTERNFYFFGCRGSRWIPWGN